MEPTRGWGRKVGSCEAARGLRVKVCPRWLPKMSAGFGLWVLAIRCWVRHARVMGSLRGHDAGHG
jgi:hypothetical protein